MMKGDMVVMSKETGTHLTMIRARCRWNQAGNRSDDKRSAIRESLYDLPPNVISLDRRRSMSVFDLSDIDDPDVEPSDAELMDLQILIDSGQLTEADLGEEYYLPEDPADDYEYIEDTYEY